MIDSQDLRHVLVAPTEELVHSHLHVALIEGMWLYSLPLSRAGLISGLEFGTAEAVQKAHENQQEKRIADAAERTAGEVAQMKRIVA